MAASGNGPAPEHAAASSICALLENPTSTVLTSGFMKAKRMAACGSDSSPWSLRKDSLWARATSRS